MSTIEIQGFVTGAFRSEGRHSLLVQLAPARSASGVVEVEVSPEVYAEYSRAFPNGPFVVEMRVRFDKQPTTC